jgi:hypothetical protein
MSRKIAAGAVRYVFEDKRLSVAHASGELTGIASVCAGTECNCLHLFSDVIANATVSFDCSKHEIIWDGPWPEEQKEGLHGGLTEAEWSLMKDIVGRFRSPLVSPFSKTDVRAIVTRRDMNSGLMVGFEQLFPFSGGIVSSCDDGAEEGSADQLARVTLFDAYCVVSACSCQDCLVGVVVETGTGEASKVRSAEFLLDLVTGTIKTAHGATAGYSAEAALGDVAKSIPDFLDTLRFRRKQIRGVVQNAWGTEEPKHNRRVPANDGAKVIARKVGRNDGCPCGSGKKFKHCCGGIVALSATS